MEMGEFNSDDHYIYYCGQEFLRRNVAIIVNKRVRNAVLGCNLRNNKRFFIVFCLRSKHLLVSWLQSLSTMTLETKLRKPVTASIFSPFSLHEVIEPDAMILVFFLSWVSIQLLHSPLLPSHCSWGSQGKNTEVVCHSLLQWTTFCQNSPWWPVHLGWPYTTWLIVSLS